MDATYLRRQLSFIKYLYSIALSQSYQPEPLCSASILSFHDAVELFLQLSLEKLNISTKELKFMQHFDVIDQALKNEKLSQKESIKRLDRARGNLKHGGVFPARSDIESFRATIQAFFTENCPIVFQIEFDNISLIDLIQFERSRELLKQAKLDFDNGLIYESLQNLILSFDYMIRDFEDSKTDKFHRSPFFFGEAVTSFDSFHLGIDSRYGKFKDFIDKITKTFESIQSAIKILSFGIDYKKYVKYKSIVSSVQVVFCEGGRVVSYKHGEVKLNKEDLDFCITFIVESALKLQEFDFGLKME